MNWDASVFWQYLLSPAFARAAWTSIWVAVLAQAVGGVVGLAAAFMGLAPSRLARAIAGFYVWLWRGTPLLVQLLILYLGLPQVGIRLSVEMAGLLGLGLNAGAYMAEIVRAGLLSVESGQAEAARSLGMSGAQTMRFIILPQAVRVTTVAISSTFRPVELYSAAALYYLAMTTAWNGVQWLLERRFTPRSRAASRPDEPRGPLGRLFRRASLAAAAALP
jgi:polar amino acid transport system permease protein